ncbi:MAG TPA: RNA pseudouridine synthase [Candidatus Moranbacteria bacterium]|nr:RNA pseudouridine synthase [Candidatus Moranbacteria bacterium]HBI50701.1 RNA pseudouridine synthase [Candidatus Moranbacteria bacterium]HBU10774.1 RNA pseudouridine synthase [Candidatus Moranbacteria bacterium]HCO99845.1 RNA pseudouridine synthase [Candidatus Moranbacteria bacterium]
MKKIIVKEENAGQRIDRFLAREFFLYSRAEIIKKIKKGEVLVNGKIIKPSYVLEEGNAIMLENFSKKESDNDLFANKDIKLDIIFENEDVVVINKQAGLQVHPSFNEKKNTLVNALLAKYPQIINVHDGSVGAELRPGIVHRLDKDTSGIMVIALNVEAFLALKENFKNRTIQKQYLAIAKGIFIEKEGIIEKSIAKSSSYKKQIIARSNTKTVIRPAETHFKVLKDLGEYSLIELTPKTGRTHQIRIHLASIGHPIVGDNIYGKEAEGVALRHLLHAQKLKFSLFEKEYEFVAPLAQDFEEFLEKIEQGK